MFPGSTRCFPCRFLLVFLLLFFLLVLVLGSGFQRLSSRIVTVQHRVPYFSSQLLSNGHVHFQSGVSRQALVLRQFSQSLQVPLQGFCQLCVQRLAPVLFRMVLAFFSERSSYLGFSGTGSSASMFS